MTAEPLVTRTPIKTPHEPIMPIFPIGGMWVDGLKADSSHFRSHSPDVFIEQGQPAYWQRGQEPMMLCTRHDYVDVNQPLITYSGRVFASMAEAGQVFTEAYNNAKAPGDEGTLITPDGNLQILRGAAGMPVPNTDPVRYQLMPYSISVALLRPYSEIEFHDLHTGPFQGYTLACIKDWGAFSVGAAYQEGKKMSETLPRFAINPVASAIWLQSFAADEVDKEGIKLSSKFMYGPVVLLRTELIVPGLYEHIANADLQQDG